MSEKEYIEITTELQQTITVDQAWHYSIVPKAVSSKQMVLYVDELKISDQIQNELEILFGKEINFEKKPPQIINKTLGRYYRRGSSSKSKANSFTVVKDRNSDDFLQSLIAEANHVGSSDIHIEVYEERCRIRMRIDGKLVERYVIDKNEYASFINKIKIKSNLDIAEKRLPQDGRIFFEQGKNKFDIRVSVLPTLYGEKIVLRLLSKDNTNIELTDLGFSKEQLDIYVEGIKKPNGIVLISGPTGSGKTTTLYATLKLLNKEFSNILTIEDPIEYTLEGVNQVQLKESIGLSFASALRTFLRQDPDIIMVGEIRDGETAQMAVRAALTGHLVLSTIHTNSAWGTISRLIDMGVPAFLIASTLNLSIAQRLVRILCPECKQEETFEESMYPRNYSYSRKVYKHYLPVGCESCYYTGYKGRKAVYEIIPVDHELEEEIKISKLDAQNIYGKRGIKTLSESAFELFEKGQTSIEEIYSILMQNY